MGYIQPDRLTKLPINGGELILHAGFDVVHFFPPLGSYILKYFNESGGGMSNVMLHPDSARYVVEKSGIEVVNRPCIFESENECLMQWQAEQLTDGEFGF